MWVNRPLQVNQPGQLSHSSLRGRQMSSKLQLDVSYSSQGWSHLVNAYEGKAGMVYLQIKLCDPCLSALRYTQYMKGAIYILSFLSFHLRRPHPFSGRKSYIDIFHSYSISFSCNRPIFINFMRFTVMLQFGRNVSRLLTIDRFVCGGDAAFCRINLTACCY